MTKVIVLGLDGCTWKIITPFAQAGILPNFKFIIKNGASAKLVSTIPPSTSPAWPSMATGLNPGKLGAYSTIMRSSRDELMFKPVTSSVYKDKAIWDYLSDRGFHVALFKIPFLYPVYKINGCMVSGFGSASKFAAYPSYLHKKLVAGPSRLLEETLFKQLETLKLGDTQACQKFIQQLTELVQEESKVVLELLGSLRWDFLFYVISPTDWLQHAFMNKLVELTQELRYGSPQNSSIVKKTLINFYKKIDSFIGCVLEFLKQTEDDYILFLVSDHGFTIRPQTFNLAKWLIEKGYMKLKARYNKNSSPIHTSTSKFSNLAEKFASQKAMERVLRALPTRIISSLANWYYNASVSSRGSFSKYIDLDKSVAFCLSDRHIYTTPSADNKAVLDKLITDLEKFLERLDGPKLKVYRKNEVYWGDKVELSPDLIIEISEGDNIWELSTDPSAPQVFRPLLPGRHDHNGIFSAYGPQIKKGVWLEDMAIWDVASTVFHIFGLQIPNNVDGEVMRAIFAPRSELAKRKIMYQEMDVKEKKEETRYTYSKKEEEKIKERLRKLGYL